jgi:hypothetical protein
MFSTLAPKSISALAILVLLGWPGVAGAKDKAAKPASDVTGAISAGTPAPAKAAETPVVVRARDAQERFSGARAAMEHALLLRENAPKSDIATIETNMKGLLDDLDAVESTGFADSVKEARRLAREWRDIGMQILAPPATGLTELPMPVSVASKAEDVGTALEWLAAETAAAKTPTPNVMASTSPVVAAPMPVEAPKAAARMTPHHARHRAPAAPAASPMAQNEASARLMRDALPLFFPPAALFTQKDGSSKR